MSADWADRILVAVEAPAGRSVGPCLLCDSKALEVESPVPLKPGDELTLHIRAGGSRRHRFVVKVRVERRDKLSTGDGARLRLAFLDLEPDRLVELAGLARERGIFQGELKLPPAPAPPPVDETPTLSARASEELEALLVQFSPQGEGRAEAVDALLSGTLFVETARAQPVNAILMVRLLLPEKRGLWLRGRVAYVADGRHGPAGMGLALDPFPEATRRELQRLR